MIEPRLKTILQATLCITYVWFVGLPTISVIYEQGYSLTLGVTKIFANHQIISVTQTMLQKSDKLTPEEAGILAMIHSTLDYLITVIITAPFHHKKYLHHALIS